MKRKLIIQNAWVLKEEMGIQNERETKEMNRKHKDYKLQIQKRRLRRRRQTTRCCHKVKRDEDGFQAHRRMDSCEIILN